VGIATEIPISADGSSLVIAGFNYVPITVASLDTTFGGTGKVITEIGGNTDEAYAAAIQGDGKIVVSGTSWIGTNYDFALARYNIDGSLDTTFGSTGKVTTDIGGIDDYAHAVARQGDGKIVAAGYSYNRTNYNSTFALVRYNMDGSLDTAFGTNGKVITAIGNSNVGVPGSSDDGAFAMAIQGDGKIVAAGYANSWNGSNYANTFALARYNTDGSLDITFGSSGIVTTVIDAYGFDYARAIVVQGDGKIVAVGYTHNGFAVVRYNTNGSLDTTFGTNGIVTTTISTGDLANAVAIQGDGKIVAAGTSWNGTNDVFALVRYNTNGSLDTTFGGTGKVTTATSSYIVDAIANAVAIQGDGKIVAAGYSNNINLNGTNDDFTLVRYNTDGSLDGMMITAIASCNAIGICNDVLIYRDSGRRKNWQQDIPITAATMILPLCGTGRDRVVVLKGIRWVVRDLKGT
jgi:uncharacterized delta-60 repeat protein